MSTILSNTMRFYRSNIFSLLFCFSFVKAMTKTWSELHLQYYTLWQKYKLWFLLNMFPYILVSNYDITSLPEKRPWLRQNLGAKTIWGDLTLKMTPPPLFLDPIHLSGSALFLYYISSCYSINKLLRNLTPFRQHVLLLYWWQRWDLLVRV